MLVLRNAVNRVHWSQGLEYLCNRMARIESQRVRDGVWRIDSGAHLKLYYTVDRAGWPTSWIWLWQRPGWKAWEVTSVWTFPEQRGRGLASLLYRSAVNTDGLLLASGNLHTQYSQALWRKFIRAGTFTIWAQDFKHLDRTSLVEIDTDADELLCDLEIYQEPKRHHPRRTDVRLLALRKDRS